VSLRLAPTDLQALVGSARWSDRGTLRAGESGGAPVFWASDGNQAKLLIGHDDATRDDAITVPFSVLDEIIRGAIRREIPVVFRQWYEPPQPDADLVRRLRTAVASVPELHDAYLVARRTAWLDQEKLERGVVGELALSRSGRGIDAARTALAPFGPPSESAPLDWCAYAHSPVPDEVRGAGIRLT